MLTTTWDNNELIELHRSASWRSTIVPLRPALQHRRTELVFFGIAKRSFVESFIIFFFRELGEEITTIAESLAHLWIMQMGNHLKRLLLLV